MAKDIAMAQAVGVHDAHAEYGVSQGKTEYELLRRVSHWTDADIAGERTLLERPQLVPSLALRSLAEVFDHSEFGAEPALAPVEPQTEARSSAKALRN